MPDSEIEELRNENSQLRESLARAMDLFERERRMQTLNRNRGGFYLRQIQRENPTASLVFSVIRENMQIGTNALTISNAALCKILGCSRTTVYRAVKYLESNNYVQVIRSGGTNTYVVNEQICFAGRPGQRTAVFSSTVIAHECEQNEGWDDVRKLRAVPVILENERPVIGNDDLPPPDQLDLDLT